MTRNEDAQALIATHAPSMLSRVDPMHIRYLRLTENRITRITHICLPKTTDESYKFVREAIQAFPEIYFSRLVVLGEGDSEQIVLPRVLRVRKVPVDESAVTIAPLGGRHVNHFWRLLSDLGIPYITLLDLDVARYQGGWGRIKYINDQLAIFAPENILPKELPIPKWNSTKYKVREYSNYIEALEDRDVYFSFPLDLDFTMLSSFPEKYGAAKVSSSESTIKSVLGEKHHDSSQYSEDELKLFDTYHKCFKLGSKPAIHLHALAQLSEKDFLDSIPESLNRLADAVIAKLAELPE